jgi:exodeoxyribonuclease VII small subunit
MSTAKKSAKSIQEPKAFEAAIERLQELVGALEAGDVPLEESLAAFEEGQMLISYCQQKLTSAEETLAKLAAETGEGPEAGE